MTEHKTRDQRDAEAHETDQKRVEWVVEGEKIWALHRALTASADPAASETLRNLGQSPAPSLFTDDQRQKLSELYYKKLLAL